MPGRPCTGSFWPCSNCLRSSRAHGRPPPGDCPGAGVFKDLQGAEFKQLGHKPIVLDTSDGGVLLVCLVCKSYTSGGQMRGLRKPCIGPPGKHAADHGRRCAWSRIASGRHAEPSSQVHVQTGLFFAAWIFSLCGCGVRTAGEEGEGPAEGSSSVTEFVPAAPGRELQRRRGS